MGDDDFGGLVAAAATGMILIVVVIFVYLFLAALFLAGAGIVWYFNRRRQQAVRRSRGGPAPRWFNAPPETQWVMTWEYLLYKLENLTGTAWMTSPRRILAGSLILSLGTAGTTDGLLLLMNPAWGQTALPILLVIGGALAGTATWKLSQPMNWFVGGGDAGGEFDQPDVVILGDWLEDERR